MAHQPDHDCIHDYGVIAHQWAAERRPALDRAIRVPPARYEAEGQCLLINSIMIASRLHRDCSPRGPSRDGPTACYERIAEAAGAANDGSST